MSTVWRADLFANAGRTGAAGFVKGWIMNPGFAVATLYRLMHWGYRRGDRIGKAVSVLAWRRIVRGYGCYIDPAVRIGPGLRLPHPTGIVIGAGTVIGAGVTLYQNVTLGRRIAERAGCPALGDGVVVYAGAIVIGAVSIGERAVIGANRVVAADVTARTTVTAEKRD